MLCHPTAIFVGFDIVFMYSKTTLEISSRTNMLFQAVLTACQIDYVITIAMKDPPRIISSIEKDFERRFRYDILTIYIYIYRYI